MSGFEVAGVVLGAIPLIISALEHYKSGKSVMATFMKYQGLLDTLILRLKNQRITYYLNIMILLKAAGVEDLTNHDEADCVEALMDQENLAKVQNYLGFTYSTFMDIILEYERCLKLIAAKLENLERTSKYTDKGDLQAILRAYPASRDQVTFRRRLHFTIERGSLKQLIEDLKEDNLNLETIIRGMRTMHEFEPSSISNSTAKMFKQFRHVQKAARALHSAISSGWKSCYHPSHDIVVHLEDRVLKPYSQTGSRNKILFELFLSPNDKYSIERSWQQAIIHWEEDRGQLPSALKQTSSTKKPRIVVPEDPIQKASPVTDICKVVNQAITAQKDISFYLHTTTLLLPEHDTDSPNCCFSSSCVTATTLEEFLIITSSCEELQLSYKDRTTLALRLASSILQLNSTPWLTTPLTKSTIRFFSQNDNTIDTTRPTIHKTLHQPSKRPTSAAVPPPMPFSATHPSAHDPKPTFLELGLLLLEIWHHESLQMRLKRRQEQCSDTLDGRRTAAIRWLEATQNKLPLNYLRAIEACLQFSAGRLRAWDEEEFAKQVCADVVMPLRENCKVW